MQNIEMLFSPEQIQERIAELADEIVENGRSKHRVLIGVLNGSYMFVADLARALYKSSVSLAVDFIKVSSYHDATASSGDVRIEKAIRLTIRDRHVLVVDDILDTGNTLSSVLKIMETYHPESIETCVLLDKPDRRVVPVRIDYTGFQVPNQFVVGYGLDFAEKYRELPYLGILKAETE
jgi:hypoxanthine phosphoribosyltransferase